MTDLPHFHTSHGHRTVIRGLKMEYGARDGGMEFGIVYARHKYHAVNSRHMESNIIIVIYVKSQGEREVRVEGGSLGGSHQAVISGLCRVLLGKTCWNDRIDDLE